MNFGDALRAMREAGPVQRSGWPSGRHVALHRSTSADEQPYLLVRNPGGDHVPWTPTHGDLLASDWQHAPLAKDGSGSWLPREVVTPRPVAPAGEATDVDKAAARVVVAFASRDGNDNLYQELLEPMQALDEALDHAGRT